MRKDDKSYIGWCARQRRGIRLIDGSELLRQAYRKKSRDSIVALQSLVESGVGTWAASASYYAKYHAVYALFMQVGIKCEIHDCTIAVFKEVFDDAALDGLAADLAGSKKIRAAAQYYEGEYDIGEGAGRRLIGETCRFVSAVDAFAGGLDDGKIGELRARLGELMAQGRRERGRREQRPRRPGGS